jgi:pyrroloquinoline quinone (PQQ) biosynthesis protein C
MSPSPTSDIVLVLDRLIEDTVATLRADPVFGRIFDGTASRELYLRFLTETFHYVKQTQLQLQAGARALRDHPDPARRALAARFAHHEEEEIGHERWVLDDIRALGGDVEAAERAEPGAAVKAYLAMGAFVWQSRHPLGLMGIGTLLEGISEKLGTSAARNLEERSGIAGIGKALSFLRSHGEADVGHMEEARAALRSVADERDREVIVLCAKMTALYYTHLLYTGHGGAASGPTPRAPAEP